MRRALIALVFVAATIQAVSAATDTEEAQGDYSALMQKVSMVCSTNDKPDKCRAEVIVLLDDATTTTDRAISCNVATVTGMYTAEKCDWAIETAKRISTNASALRNNGVKLN